MSYRTATLLMLMVCCAWPARAEAQSDRSGWSHWKQLPVHHEGRIMPLDTLARQAVEVICGRQNPTLSLAGSLSAGEIEAAHMAEARSLFRDGERRFAASELLLSWLVEPEKWEEVPFLIAKHDELREEILDLPILNDEGERIGFISPAQLEANDGFMAWIEDISRRKREAGMSGGEFVPSGIDGPADKLFDAWRLYRSISLGGILDPRAKDSFATALREAINAWGVLNADSDYFGQLAAAGGFQSQVAQAKDALAQMAEITSRANIDRSEADALAVAFADAAGEIATQFRGYERRLAQSPPEADDESLARLRENLLRLTTSLAGLESAADRLVLSVYKNGDPLRVVPALNPAALESDREPGDDAQPWLDLETLLFASDRALTGYPISDVRAVRDSFRSMAQAYSAADGPSDQFADATEQLALTIRQLGEHIEPIRRALPIERPDETLLAYTAYPDPKATIGEVTYNDLDPFMWSWVISFAAMCCFVLFIIGFRSSVPFWIGMAILAGSLGWSVYGFALRIAITGWAPVTNMYETVVFVPFVVSLMGVWFALLPLTWNGVKLAWRMTALPHTWEATELDASQQAISKSACLTANFISILPRVALSCLVLWMLAIAPYAAGGRTIINLLPVVDVGQRFPDANDLATWGTGLCVLVPTVWYLPRVLLTVFFSLATIPLVLRDRSARSELVDQTLRRWPFGLAAATVATLGAFIAWYSPVLDEKFAPLQPILRDNFWLLIHVLTIVSSYAAGALAWGLGNLALAYYLFGKYREPAAMTALPEGHVPAGGGAAAAVGGGGTGSPGGQRRPPEQCAELAGFVYKSAQVAVVLLAAGTILGALWADVAWGRFWGWDPKEVWALISLLVYMAFLHGRYAGWVGNFGLCAASVAGATAIMMSWYGVNFWLGAGLHSYGFGEGGQYYVFGVVAVNWVFLALAALRYLTR